jgi:uncharacterized protein
LQPIIPDAALGQHIAVLGKTGSGKTFAAKASIVEPLLELGRRVSVVDPTGAWWGLRSSRDGKGPGFPVIVLGGDHGDLPLPANGGAAVARLITEQGVNLVADTSQLTMGESARWFTDFASTLYRSNRSPLHLVIDEAHNFAPQGKVPDPDTGKMLHAANKLASGGRSRGIRLVMITQRPQKLHKDTLTSADTLIAMRVLAPQDREAVEDWIKGCGDREHGKEVLNSLASLKRGEGWIWYPEGMHLKRAHFPEIRTFDSSATPTDGGTIASPKGSAEVDLAEIRAALADAVKEAEANDPKLLRAEISKLKADLAKKPAEKVSAVDYSALRAAEERGRAHGLIEIIDGLRPAVDRFKTLSGALADQVDAMAGDLKRLASRTAQPKAPPQGPAGSAGARVSRTPAAAAGLNGGMPKVERAFLTALAQQARQLTRNQVAIFAGYSANSRHVDNTLAALRSKGYVQGGGDAITITAEGTGALGAYQPLPTGAALRAYWQRELDKAAGVFLGVICDAYPDTLTRDEVAGRAGYSVDSRHVDNTLAQLRSRDLITGSGKAIKASEDLFDG